MGRYVANGKVVPCIAPEGGVVGGSFYQIGQLFGRAVATVAAAATFQLEVTGVVEGTKVGSQAWAQNGLIYWDNSARKFTTVAAGNLQIGSAYEPVGSGASETTGKVRLDGVARANEES
jgi:predicted RecA/RadA family phage recombinase